MYERSYITTNTSRKLDAYIKESFGWKLVGAKTSTLGEVNGPFKKVHNVNTIKYEYLRVDGYGKNLLFKLTETVTVW